MFALTGAVAGWSPSLSVSSDPSTYVYIALFQTCTGNRSGGSLKCFTSNLSPATTAAGVLLLIGAFFAFIDFFVVLFKACCNCCNTKRDAHARFVIVLISFLTILTGTIVGGAANVYGVSFIELAKAGGSMLGGGFACALVAIFLSFLALVLSLGACRFLPQPPPLPPAYTLTLTSTLPNHPFEQSRTAAAAWMAAARAAGRSATRKRAPSAPRTTSPRKNNKNALESVLVLAVPAPPRPAAAAAAAVGWGYCSASGGGAAAGGGGGSGRQESHGPLGVDNSTMDRLRSLSTLPVVEEKATRSLTILFHVLSTAVVLFAFLFYFFSPSLISRVSRVRAGMSISEPAIAGARP